MNRIVPVGVLHTREMVGLLNETTRAAITAEDLKERLTRDRSVWSVAETADGSVLGFQWIEPATGSPADEAEIATVIRDLKIGFSLFERTKAQAKKIGYRWINAEVRPENENSLSYYQSRGFEAIRRAETLLMRYEL